MPPKAAPRQQPARRNANATRSANESAASTANDQPAATDRAAPSNLSPASSSSRPPVQRLESLNRRNPSEGFSVVGSIGAPSAKPTLKFKPKSVIRRSKEERDAQERLELEKQQAREAAAGAGGQESSRGGAAGKAIVRGARGRGAFGGPMRGTGRWQGHGDREGAMSGPFGAGFISREEMAKKKVVRGGDRFSISASEGRSTRVKNEPGFKADKDVDGDVVIGEGSTSGGTRIKTEDPGAMYISSDDEEHQNEGPRMNIEQINLVSDEEDDEESSLNKGKGRATTGGTSGWVLKPIRIDRKEHIERAVGVNTDASSMTSAELRKRAMERGDKGDSLFLPMDGDEEVEKPKKAREKSRDVEFLKDERKWKGVYQDEKEMDNDDEAKIKEEPMEDDEDSTIDLAAVLRSRPNTNNAETPALPAAPPEPESVESQVKPKPKRRRKLKFKETKPVLQTEEDRQEWARHEEDIRLLDQELRLMDTGPTSMLAPTKDQDAEGDTSMGDGLLPKISEQKEGRIYLIQIPPLIPRLVDEIKLESSPPPEEIPPPPPTSQPSRPPILAPKSKPQPTPNPAPAPTTQPTTQPHRTNPIKPDPSGNTALTALHPPNSTGRVGTLKLKQSGRVVLAWGDTSFELGRGADCEFLQDVVLASQAKHYGYREEEEKDEEEWVGSGREMERERVREEKGWGLGQVMGGFVLVPDWRRLFG